jgi:hypothetical protein
MLINILKHETLLLYFWLIRGGTIIVFVYWTVVTPLLIGLVDVWGHHVKLTGTVGYIWMFSNLLHNISKLVWKI